MYFIAFRVYLLRENTRKIQEEIRILEIRLGRNQGRRTEYTPLLRMENKQSVCVQIPEKWLINFFLIFGMVIGLCVFQKVTWPIFEKNLIPPKNGKIGFLKHIKGKYFGRA